MDRPTGNADILLKNAILIDGSRHSIAIRGGVISSIGDENISASKVLDCSDKIAMPPFVNAHTHAAMTLFRGWGDDLPLHEWLNDKIWPAEAKMTRDDVYIGTRLACLEMIRTGTLFFNDMYWHPEGTIQAVKDSGIRAMVSGVMIDMFDENVAKARRDDALEVILENATGFKWHWVRMQFTP